jgi:hypothetical protein
VEGGRTWKAYFGPAPGSSRGQRGKSLGGAHLGLRNCEVLCFVFAKDILKEERSQVTGLAFAQVHQRIVKGARWEEHD